MKRTWLILVGMGLETAVRGKRGFCSKRTKTYAKQGFHPFPGPSFLCAKDTSRTIRK